jgi:hypothetical protein
MSTVFMVGVLGWFWLFRDTAPNSDYLYLKVHFLFAIVQ